MPTANSPRRKGGALLAVLWMSAALAAIGFSVATTIRSETDHASTAADGVSGHWNDVSTTAAARSVAQ